MKQAIKSNLNREAKMLLVTVMCVLSNLSLHAQTVGPLIQTQWDQGSPYNLMIPEKDGVHCLTSCGATAEAQLCYYHRWPEHGMGQGYYHISGEDFVYVDLTQDNYDYDKMLLKYDANSSEEAKKAVALLMRDVAFTGAVLDVDVSASPSYGYLASLLGFDYGMTHLDGGYCTIEDIKTILRTELDAARPVIVDGSNGSAGHSFICDGYNDKGEFHFNYGWSGKSDGWSTLENCLFPLSMSIVFNIKKDEGGDPGFAFCSNKDFKWVGGNTLSGNYKFDCFFSHEVVPQIALAVENTETHEVQYFYHYDKEPGDPNDVELVWELNEDLPDGSYILYPVGHGKEKSVQWQKAYFRALCQHEVALTVKDGVKTFANASMNDPVRDGAVEVDGLCFELDQAAGTATFTYRNDKYASYFGDIVIPESITFDGKNYNVTAIGENAFRECKHLGNVTIGKNVTYIGWAAFDQASVGDVTFAEGSQLDKIEKFGFYSASFKNVVLPEGLRTIGATAFANSKINCITIPTTVTSWGESCFYTENLVSVRVNSTTPQTVPDIFRKNIDDADYSSFNGSWGIYGISATVLYVPAGSKDAYAQADVWKDFGFILEPDDDDSFVASIFLDAVEVDGVLYQVNGTKGIARAIRVKKGVKEAVLKNTLTMGSKTLHVKSVGSDLLYDNKDVDKIVVAASVETIEEDAFDENVGSLEFEAGSRLKTIEHHGLYALTLRSPLVLPEGLESLGRMWITVPDITIPSTVTKMEDTNVFFNLSHCRVSWPTPLVVRNLFDDFVDVRNATLHVPEGTKALYEAADGWKQFGKIVEDGGKSAILSISTGQTDNTDDAWYTLDGRRVTQPTKKGLYIHKGQKITVR